MSAHVPRTLLLHTSHTSQTCTHPRQAHPLDFFLALFSFRSEYTKVLRPDRRCGELSALYAQFSFDITGSLLPDASFFSESMRPSLISASSSSVSSRSS